MNDVNSIFKKIEIAIKAMDIAKKISLEWFHKSVPSSMKPDNTPVTLADKKIEELIHKLVLEHWPNTSFLGEETGLSKGTNNNGIWLLDPIDGTKSFMIGSPLFGNLLAYLENDIPIFGVAMMPMLNQLWLGVDIKTESSGASCNGKPIKIINTKRLSESILSLTSPDMFTIKDKNLVDRIMKKAKFCNYGGDCFNYLTLATGRIDIIIEADLKAVDIIPLIPIIKQAGGIITDWNNNDITLNSNEEKYKIIATTSNSLHLEVLELIHK